MHPYTARFATRTKTVRLRPLDSPALLQQAVDWLNQKDNAQWLDFGDGCQTVSTAWLRIGMQRGTYVVRLFTSDTDDTPIGVVGLSNVHPHFKTANIWIVLGDKSYANRGCGSEAASKMLTLGFTELGLRAINTWIAEPNHSIRIAERLKFRFIGRQRQCHVIDGRPYDRLLFDLLASEHTER